MIGIKYMIERSITIMSASARKIGTGTEIFLQPLDDAHEKED